MQENCLFWRQNPGEKEGGGRKGQVGKWKRGGGREKKESSKMLKKNRFIVTNYMTKASVYN